ncbi:hypothetical protein HPB50_009886 [Hyalomma asiaticum]|uniref:Uncharacterized protein n=1 Tax=Hyalomma asiaticum TaxID=266040 RepID=A0ACB7RK11_HYAAI|nr:hypothetical protein HPB50_009886 [Hyalomma asiaticum]
MWNACSSVRESSRVRGSTPDENGERRRGTRTRGRESGIERGGTVRCRVGEGRAGKVCYTGRRRPAQRINETRNPVARRCMQTRRPRGEMALYGAAAASVVARGRGPLRSRRAQRTWSSSFYFQFPAAASSGDEEEGPSSAKFNSSTADRPRQNVRFLFASLACLAGLTVRC